MRWSRSHKVDNIEYYSNRTDCVRARREVSHNFCSLSLVSQSVTLLIDTCSVLTI